MAWKIERWLADVFPGEEKIYSEYRLLPDRELAVVSAAVLDVALAELISLRVNGPTEEVEDFLGADGDGRAPAGSFGARIQLGILVGILTSADAAVLRYVKQIRNAFAHKTKVSFLSPEMIKQTTRLTELLEARIKELNSLGLSSVTGGSVREIRQYLPVDSEAGAAILLAVFSLYQAYFHRLHTRIKRVDDLLGSG